MSLVCLALSYLLKSSQRNDFKGKKIDMEYVTEYSVQILAETFLKPKKLSVGYCNAIACLAIQSAQLLCQIKTNLCFHHLTKISQRVKVVPRNNTDRWTDSGSTQQC